MKLDVKLDGLARGWVGRTAARMLTRLAVKVQDRHRRKRLEQRKAELFALSADRRSGDAR